MRMSREEFYEMVAMALTREEFIRQFDCEPLDPMDFDYSFKKVHWNQALEFGYDLVND